MEKKLLHTYLLLAGISSLSKVNGFFPLVLNEKKTMLSFKDTKSELISLHLPSIETLNHLHRTLTSHVNTLHNLGIASSNQATIEVGQLIFDLEKRLSTIPEFTNKLELMEYVNTPNLTSIIQSITEFTEKTVEMLQDRDKRDTTLIAFPTIHRDGTILNLRTVMNCDYPIDEVHCALNSLPLVKPPTLRNIGTDLMYVIDNMSTFKGLTHSKLNEILHSLQISSSGTFREKIVRLKQSIKNRQDQGPTIYQERLMSDDEEETNFDAVTDQPQTSEAETTTEPPPTPQTNNPTEENQPVNDDTTPSIPDNNPFQIFVGQEMDAHDARIRALETLGKQLEQSIKDYDPSQYDTDLSELKETHQTIQSKIRNLQESIHSLDEDVQKIVDTQRTSEESAANNELNKKIVELSKSTNYIQNRLRGEIDTQVTEIENQAQRILNLEKSLSRVQKTSTDMQQILNSFSNDKIELETIRTEQMLTSALIAKLEEQLAHHKSYMSQLDPKNEISQIKEENAKNIKRIESLKRILDSLSSEVNLVVTNQKQVLDQAGKFNSMATDLVQLHDKMLELNDVHEELAQLSTKIDNSIISQTDQTQVAMKSLEITNDNINSLSTSIGKIQNNVEALHKELTMVEANQDARKLQLQTINHHFETTSRKIIKINGVSNFLIKAMFQKIFAFDLATFIEAVREFQFIISGKYDESLPDYPFKVLNIYQHKQKELLILNVTKTQEFIPADLYVNFQICGHLFCITRSNEAFLTIDNGKNGIKISTCAPVNDGYICEEKNNIEQKCKFYIPEKFYHKVCSLVVSKNTHNLKSKNIGGNRVIYEPKQNGVYQNDSIVILTKVHEQEIVKIFPLTRSTIDRTFGLSQSTILWEGFKSSLPYLAILGLVIWICSVILYVFYKFRSLLRTKHEYEGVRLQLNDLRNGSD